MHVHNVSETKQAILLILSVAWSGLYSIVSDDNLTVTFCMWVEQFCTESSLILSRKCFAYTIVMNNWWCDKQRAGVMDDEALSRWYPSGVMDDKALSRWYPSGVMDDKALSRWYPSGVMDDKALSRWYPHCANNAKRDRFQNRLQASMSY